MKEILLERKTWLPSIVIAIAYVVAAIYLMNFSLVKNTVIGDYPFTYKYTLLVALLGGMWTAMTKTSLLLLVLAALLTGISFTLVTRRLLLMKSLGRLEIVAGGSSLLGIATSGCAVCGLPLLAVLGLSGSLAYLPWRGTELSLLAVGLLAVSFVLTLKAYRKAVACKVDYEIK